MKNEKLKTLYKSIITLALDWKEEIRSQQKENNRSFLQTLSDNIDYYLIMIYDHMEAEDIKKATLLCERFTGMYQIYKTQYQEEGVLSVKK
jgi:hypothetical protein